MWIQGIELLGQVRSDDVTGGVIGPHWGSCVRDSLTQHGPWVVCSDTLALNHGNSRVIEILAHGHRAVPQNPSEIRALSDLFHHGDRRLGVAELLVTGIHRDRHGHTRTHRVDTDVVAQMVESGDHIQIDDAGHAACRPDGLILQGAGNEVAVLVHVFIGTMNHALAAALMCGLAPSLFDDLRHPLAADIFPTIKRALARVVAGKRAHTVDGCDQRRRPEFGQYFAAHVIRLHKRHHILDRRLKSLWIGYGIRRFPTLIDHKRLQTLGAHDGAHAPASSGTARSAIDVRRLDRSSRKFVLPGRPDTQNGDFFAVRPQHIPHELVGAHAVVGICRY